MVDLGMRVAFWNGLDDDEAATLGMYAGGFSTRVGNSLSLRFPTVLGELSRAEVTCAIATNAVRAVQPDWVSVYVGRARTRERLAATGLPLVDWIFYWRLGLLEQLPRIAPSMRVVSIDGYGTVLVTTPHVPCSRTDDEERECETVERALRLSQLRGRRP